MRYIKLPVSEIRQGDLLPLVTFGAGAEVASVTDRRVGFTEPVQSRYSPGVMVSGLSVLSDDELIVFRQCEAMWPSAASGGMTDAQCVEGATVPNEGAWYCTECASEAVA